MKPSQIVKKHIQTLEHFIEQGGYPLKIQDKPGFMSPKAAEEFCKDVPGVFAIENGMLFRDKSHGWDYELLAEYWKYRCQEEQKELKRVFSIIDKAHSQL